MSYRELWLFRYTNEGAAGVHSGGFGTRRAVLSEAIAAGDPDEVDAHVAGLGETSWKPAGS